MPAVSAVSHISQSCGIWADLFDIYSLASGLWDRPEWPSLLPTSCVTTGPIARESCLSTGSAIVTVYCWFNSNGEWGSWEFWESS